MEGKETADPENDSQFPFFEELHELFTERAKNMKRRLLESEAGSDSSQAKKSMKITTADRSSDEFSEQGEDEDGSEEEKPIRGISRERKKADTNTMPRMEMQWGEMMERRARKRKLFEQEWRQSMEKLERERLMAEKAWREREEEKRRREESLAERRDSLLPHS
ncbi:Solute:sodium symporter [Hibiscus syriacus]|uniref:Solute:sodium symporter n=1 Tax=Hibiscus syriacus TaxID=106335 RepID=A0A6A3AE43_HIBSY|nr:Solute:sodium symporter [Hibiscus syriacus]